MHRSTHHLETVMSPRALAACCAVMQAACCGFTGQLRTFERMNADPTREADADPFELAELQTIRSKPGRFVTFLKARALIRALIRENA